MKTDFTIKDVRVGCAIVWFAEEAIEDDTDSWYLILQTKSARQRTHDKEVLNGKFIKFFDLKTKETFEMFYHKFSCAGLISPSKKTL
jgi:hypothetical protein